MSTYCHSCVISPWTPRETFLAPPLGIHTLHFWCSDNTIAAWGLLLPWRAAAAAAEDSVPGGCNHFCLPCRHISPPLCQAALRSVVTLQERRRRQEEEGGRLLSWTGRPIGGNICCMRQLPTCNHLLAAARDRTAQDRRGALIRIFLGAERVSSPWPGCKAARRRGRDVSGRPECVAHLPNRDGPECQAEIFRVPKFRLQLSCRAQVHFLARSCIQTRLRPSERASERAQVLGGVRKSSNVKQ